MRYATGIPATNPDNAGRTGVLLANLGTPESPTSSSVRRYLAEFLKDPRVVELPAWLWWPILHGVILRIRPPKTARAYQQIWRDDGSPLLAIASAQCRSLQSWFDQQGGDRIHVALGMRYGQPSIASALEELVAAGSERIIVLPLYPQYSSSTTASIYDAVGATFAKWRNLPELVLIKDYHTDPGYVRALANSIRRHWEANGKAEKLMLSFHGTPQRYARAGDPYSGQCQATSTALAAELGLSESEWMMTFQSRFGREPWLQPYTDETLSALPGKGVKGVDILCPGFSADCLETLEEIEEENREIFLEAGGTHFGYIPCLNDDDDHIEALGRIIQMRL
jgi:ferrochelatase